MKQIEYHSKISIKQYGKRTAMVSMPSVADEKETPNARKTMTRRFILCEIEFFNVTGHENQEDL